jgi:alkylation response protein AidB-like acyl-CoA dehydrogenase
MRRQELYAVNRINEIMPGHAPLDVFLNNFRSRLRNIFGNPATAGRLALKRGIPPLIMREILSADPLSVGIPAQYGGRGGKIEENLAMLSVAAYESLGLSLTLGINSALFLQPVAKYAREEVKAPIFERFLKDRNMGGLMITEPGFGSDALNMQSSYTGKDDKYHIQGTKHWAGLTGMAEFWLLTARENTGNDDLRRDIDFFICDVKGPGQQIVVEEYYENLGLYQIPYGKNRVDVEIPARQKLVPETTGVKMMLDLLHRSRMQFPGMGVGFVQRMLDEAISHTRKRQIGRKKLAEFDQVQHRLAKMQASYTIFSAMCASSSKKAGIENDLSSDGFEANSIKTIVTDLMQEAAQSATQLIGAQAYKLNHIAGRGIIDSRPFQIFEGSNDILYAQISESLIKMMKKAKESNLLQFLKNFRLTSKAAERLKYALDFSISTDLPQRKLVELGQVLGRIVSSEKVIELGDTGFRKDLVDNGLAILSQEIASLLGSFRHENSVRLVEDYQYESSWHPGVRQ